jgi:hypothetical protein
VKQRRPADSSATNQQVDPLLSPYLHATDEYDLQRLAEQLISVHARPIIRGIIKYKLLASLDHGTSNVDSQEAEDVYSDVVLELLAWLRKFKACPEDNGVKNFCGFVAVLAYRACATYMRKKHPQRLKLKNRIYYALTHNSQLALWKNNEDEWVCGLSAWRNCELVCTNSRLDLAGRDPRAFEQATLPSGGDIRQLPPVDLLTAIFNWVQTPVRLDDVVRTLAELLDIRDQSEDAGLGHTGDGATAPKADLTTEIEQRTYLERIWVEIVQLPLRQRNALLLNLTDSVGNRVIALLPVIGIASFQEIAEALGMTAEQLGELWNNLPLDDATIAIHLGVTRQQVINLRKSARERLLRRMKTKGGSNELVFSTARG